MNYRKKTAYNRKIAEKALKEAKERVKTAVKAAKENKNILVVARTDALTAGSLDETITRALHFKKLGADCIFITGINSIKQLNMINKKIKNIRLMLNITQNVKFTLNDVSKNKFKFALFSQQILNGYIDSTKQTLDLIKKNVIPKYKNKASDTLNLLDFKKYIKIEEGNK